MKLIAIVLGFIAISGAIAHKHVPVKTCFSGFTLFSDGTCQKEINEPAYNSCPGGKAGLDGNCEVVVPHIATCLEGLQRTAEGCVGNVALPPTYYCPEGFKDGGRFCVKETEGEIAEICDPPATLVDGQCITVRKASHIVVKDCPAGAFQDGDKCWITQDTYDCTGLFGQSKTFLLHNNEPAPGIVVKPLGGLGAVLDKEGLIETARKFGHSQSHGNTRFSIGPAGGHSKKGGLRALHAKGMVEVSDPHSPAAAAVAAANTSPPPAGAARVKVVSQVCQKTEEVEGTTRKVCPDGLTDGGGCCYSEDFSEPRRICKSNNGDPETCPPLIERVAKTASCPDDAKVVNGVCVKRGVFPTETTCPDNFKDNGTACVGTVPAQKDCHRGKLTLDGRCVGKIVKKAIELKVSKPDPPKPTKVPSCPV